MNKAYTAADVRKSAMDLLARREHSSYELSTKLERRFEGALISQEVQKLSNEGLQSDQRFAEAFIRSRVQKGHGPAKIRFDLSQRRVNGVNVDQIFQDLDVNWYDQIEAVVLKKFGSMCFDDKSQRDKAVRFLMSRGFVSSDIFAVLS
jgi:regulatory protein